VGRKTKYTKRFPGRVEIMARGGMIEVDMAKQLGVSVQTFEDYKQKYPLFLESLKKGKETIDDIVVAKLLTRALGYNFDEIVRERISDNGQKSRHSSGQALTLTLKEWRMAVKFFGGLCAYCGKRKKLTKDHVIPLIQGGGLTADNTIPACGICNSSKKDNDIKEWYKTQEFYDEQRFLKITEYLAMVQRQVISNELAIIKVTTKHIVPDTTAMIFWLKNRRPEEWREQKHVDQEQQVTPELKQTINVLAILNQKAPEAFDKFVEVTTVPSANGTVRKKKQISTKTKTKRRRKT